MRGTHPVGRLPDLLFALFLRDLEPLPKGGCHRGQGGNRKGGKGGQLRSLEVRKRERDKVQPAPASVPEISASRGQSAPAAARHDTPRVRPTGGRQAEQPALSKREEPQPSVEILISSVHFLAPPLLACPPPKARTGDPHSQSSRLRTHAVGNPKTLSF